jgi:hypothetical protein
VGVLQIEMPQKPHLNISGLNLFCASQKKFLFSVRNHGDSPHTQHHSYELMASDLAQLYNDLRLKKANLIGHSMGGRAVMLFALKYVSFHNIHFESERFHYMNCFH